MIVIKTRQPDPELEQKIRMLLEREHIEAEHMVTRAKMRFQRPMQIEQDDPYYDRLLDRLSANPRKAG